MLRHASTIGAWLGVGAVLPTWEPSLQLLDTHEGHCPWTRSSGVMEECLARNSQGIRKSRAGEAEKKSPRQ